MIPLFYGGLTTGPPGDYREAKLKGILFDQKDYHLLLLYVPSRSITKEVLVKNILSIDCNID